MKAPAVYYREPMQLSGWGMKLSSLALAALVAACGAVKGDAPDGGGGDGQSGDFTLSVAPSTLSIPIAGSATVAVNVTRTGSVGEITLTADGLGTSLTADLAPIAADATTAQVTIHAVGAMPPGTSTVTITGMAGGKTHADTVDVTTTKITVIGRIRDGRSGITVGMIGKQTVTSGSSGEFTFTDVTPPYDLYTQAIGGCSSFGSTTPTVYYYQELTRTDPTVNAANVSSCIFSLCPNPSSNVSGSKSGAGNNTDPVLWAWSEGSFNSPTLNTNGTFGGSASWCSGNTNTGSLHALQLTRKANGAPNTFLGYAKSAQATLTSGSAATINLTFSAVASTNTISGTLNPPTGAPPPSVTMYQQFGNSSQVMWEASTTAIDAAFPVLASAGGSSLYARSEQAGVGISAFVHPLTSTATLNFTMAAPALLLTPAAAATGVTTQTPFTFTPATGAVSLVSISGGGRNFNVYTTKAALTIPAVAEQPLPAGASYTWSITSFTPTTSINDAAATTELEYVSALDYTGSAHATSFSVGRAFTTQ